MRAFLFLTLFIISLTNGFFAQEKLTRNSVEEIQQHINYHRKQKNTDSLFYFLDERIRFYIGKNNEKEIILSYAKKIDNLILFNQPAKAFELSLKTFNSYCNTSENCKNCSKIYLNLAKLMITMQDYKQGVKYINLTCENQKHLLAYYYKADLYRLLELPDSALITAEKGIDWAKKRNNPKELIGAYNNYGLIAKSLNKFHLAITAFSKALELIEKDGGNIDNYAYIMGNLGSCFFKVGEYDKAYECLLIDSKGSIKQSQKSSYIFAELNLAEIESLRKEHQKATKRLNNLINNYDEHLTPPLKLTTLKSLINTYKTVGNESKYKYHSDQWIELNEVYFQNQIITHKTLIEQQTTDALKQVTEKIALERQLMDQKILIQQKENEQKQLKILALIGLLLASLIVGLLLFLRFKAIQAKKARIKDTNLKLALKEKEILALKVKEENRNVQVLSHELTLKQNFSTSLIKQMAQLENISKAELKSIELFVQNELDVKSTRGLIQQQMGDLSSNFYANLKIKHPSLSKSDIAFAAMVAMNMTNKEIGISKNMTTESVKTTKYRLKKKLNLPLSESMDDYLTKLLKE